MTTTFWKRKHRDETVEQSRVLFASNDSRKKRGIGGEVKTARTATKVCLMIWGDVTQNGSGMAEASEQLRRPQ
jgi:hypothetical protein